MACFTANRLIVDGRGTQKLRAKMEISGIKGANEAIQHNHYCYDQRDYIGDAVKSAISQGDQLKEVIVVDDASSDGSPEVLSQYAEAIQVIEFPRNRGAPEVRNRGAASAQGEYLVFLDGDDVLLPWALATLRRKNPSRIFDRAKQHPRASLFASTD